MSGIFTIQPHRLYFEITTLMVVLTKYIAAQKFNASFTAIPAATAAITLPIVPSK